MAALLALGSAYFMVGTGSLCVIGLVLPISDNLQVSPPDVAWLVTVFALTFALSAPTGQILFSRFARVKILCGGLILMALAMLLAGLSDDYATLFVSRALLGIGAALVSPMCSAIGSGLVPLSQQGRAMAIVFGGLTVSTVVGVPLSAWAGNIIGWRAVMILIAGLAMVALIVVLVFVRDRSAGTQVSFGHLFSAITQKKSGLTVLTTLLQMAAMLSTYALIAPYMVHKFDVAPDDVFILLFVYGGCGILGNIIAGRLSDRMGPDKVIWLGLAGSILTFLILLVIGPSMVIGLAVLCVWSVTGMIFHTPQQQRIVAIAGEQRSLLLALNASALYLGMSFGSWMSRQASVEWGYESLPAFSAALMVLCALVFFASQKSLKKASVSTED
jgi:MFS transporter, DHA1 family, inner membrane transport protein